MQEEEQEEEEEFVWKLEHAIPDQVRPTRCRIAPAAKQSEDLSVAILSRFVPTKASPVVAEPEAENVSWRTISLLTLSRSVY